MQLESNFLLFADIRVVHICGRNYSRQVKVFLRGYDKDLGISLYRHRPKTLIYMNPWNSKD